MPVKVQAPIEPYNDSYKAVNAKHVGFDDGDAEKSLDSMFNETPANIGDGSAARQLNNRHLEPFEFVYTGDPVDIFAERTVTGFAYDSATGYWYAAQGFSASGLQDGQTYIVVWNGTKYTCVATSMASEILLGNMKPFGFEDNGYPFLISGAGWMYALDSEAASHVVRVYQNPPGKWVLKSARLPSGVGTGGSDITVDSELSLDSENPVQNKVVTQEFKAFNEAVGEINRRVSSLESGGLGGGEYEIPTFDLVTLGLPALALGAEAVTLETDTTEIIAALSEGPVKFIIPMDSEGTATAEQFVMNGMVASDGGAMCSCLILGAGVVYLVFIPGMIFGAFLPLSSGEGGGSGGVSSWNDLTDKPFGENEDGTVKQLDNKYLEPFEGITEEELLPSVTGTTELYEDLGVYAAISKTTEEMFNRWNGNGDNPITGNVFVEYDGVTYECTPQVLAALDNGMAVGNCTAYGGTDNGEPFIITILPKTDENGNATGDYNWTVVALTDTAPTEHQYRVYQPYDEPKYLLKEDHLPFDAIAAYIDNYIDEALGGDY